MTLTYNIAFLGILMNFLKKIYHQHVWNPALHVCAKSVLVWGKSGEMRGLVRGDNISYVVCTTLLGTVHRKLELFEVGGFVEQVFLSRHCLFFVPQSLTKTNISSPVVTGVFTFV